MKLKGKEKQLDDFLKKNDLSVNEIFDVHVKGGAYIAYVFVGQWYYSHKWDLMCVAGESQFEALEDHSYEGITEKVLNGEAEVIKYRHGYKGGSISDFKNREEE